MPPLTGLQIQKLLPGTNCKECGLNTCLAFAMKLAAKKADLAECPDVSEQSKAILGAASAPPIRSVVLGVGANTVTAGGETVMFRHEKTFVNQTAIGVALDDTMTDLELEQRTRATAEYSLERVGEEIRLDLISVAFRSGANDRFLPALDKAASCWDRAIVVRSDEPSALCDAAKRLEGRRPLLASATRDTAEEVCGVAKSTGAALAVTADNMDDLVAAVEVLENNDFKDIFLELRADSLSEHLQNNIIIRRGALKSGLKVLGYPTLKFVETGNPLDDAIEAGVEVAKYGGLVILPTFEPATLVSLLAMRQSIFTDPQKPIQVDPKIYRIGEPDFNSPVFVTTNFSLTYFIVTGELENSGISAWLLVPECEGMSVLTAWAAGKFDGDTIGSFAKEVHLEDQTSNRKIVIPGHVAQISGELEDAMPGWEVIVGPQEAGDLESFVKNVLAK
jgi:acetyl-CoA decarbonylase/synthase complex subunit gamma|tara:strand:- start:220 stop:1566 length:1347 start_codon:yes stop_codon:yes gene_type:complete